MMTAKNNYSITQSPDVLKWKRFLELSPHSTIFHTPEIYHVFSNTRNHHPLVYAIENNDEILAMLNPVLITLEPGLLHALTTRAIHYGGPAYLENEKSMQALQILLDFYSKKMKSLALFTDFRNLTDPASILPILEHQGFIKEPHINYWIHLDQPLDKIWQQFSKSARRNVRQAEKKSVVYEELSDVMNIPDFYRILECTFTMKKTPLVDISFFQKAFEQLRPAGYVKFFRARAENQYFASFLILIYKKTIYLFYSADNFEMRNFYPTDGFIWHILQWGHHQGYQLFDFGWAGRSDQPYGVRQFKEKFGGDLIAFGRHQLIHKPALLKMSKLGYNAWQIFNGMKVKAMETLIL